MLADRSFSVYGAKLWNSIPEGLRKQPTLHDFKKHLKTYPVLLKHLINYHYDSKISY